MQWHCFKKMFYFISRTYQLEELSESDFDRSVGLLWTNAFECCRGGGQVRNSDFLKTQNAKNSLFLFFESKNLTRVLLRLFFGYLNEQGFDFNNRKCWGNIYQLLCHILQDNSSVSNLVLKPLVFYFKYFSD